MNDSTETVDSVRSRVASIFEQVLGRPVEPESDLFDIGGDSADAVEIIEMVRHWSGVDIDVLELLEAGVSVRSVANLVGAAL
ncbi:acyl carrier protein [Nocardia sp. NPDC047038]|uniref:acyl carrier protein n=1 Tax=Nocardia sp. NPDC047038 TaxID=3154338 RepID=UPI0033CD6054